MKPETYLRQDPHPWVPFEDSEQPIFIDVDSILLALAAFACGAAAAVTWLI
jgi:hypothetical protein